VFNVFDPISRSHFLTLPSIAMPPKADSNKMAAAQLDAVFDAFVKFPPIGGDGDGRMVKKTGAVWGPVLEELAKTMPAVIQGIPPETSYKPMDKIDEACLKNLWSRWTRRYKEVKDKCNVRSYFQRGETGLSGDSPIPQSATAALEAGSMAWDRFALFHNAFGDCARFRDVQATSLSPIKPPSTSSPPQGTEVVHSALPSSSGTKTSRLSCI
jgi:hypothetical protein